jgi:hypothetical protein
MEFWDMPLSLCVFRPMDVLAESSSSRKMHHPFILSFVFAQRHRAGFAWQLRRRLFHRYNHIDFEDQLKWIFLKNTTLKLQNTIFRPCE